MPLQLSSQSAPWRGRLAAISPSTGSLVVQLLVVVGLLLVCRLGAFIPLPGLDYAALARDGIHLRPDYVQRLSIFALGIWPYIYASVGIQLVLWAFPRAAALTETVQGRRQINRYVRILTVLMAFYQGNSIATALERVWHGRDATVLTSSWLFHLSAMMTMAAGVMLLVWLSDQITRRGLGNGVLLILFAGFARDAPRALTNSIQLFRQGELTQEALAGLALVMAAALCAVVFIESARRPILVEACEGCVEPPALQGLSSDLTLKLNPAGVAPLIVGSALFMLLVLPLLIYADLGDHDGQSWFNSLTRLGERIHMLLKAIAVAGVAYAYGASTVDARQAAASLERNGGYLPEAESDEQQEAYIDGVQRRVAVLNALYLATLCLLPEALILYYQPPFLFGGLSLLAAVLASLNILRAFQREA